MAVNGKISGDPLATDATGVVMAGVQGGVNKGVPATLFQPAGNYQPLDADLTAIAAQGTTAYGRPLLSQADAVSARAYLGILDEPTYPDLNAVAVDMWNGVAVGIECFGDSTMVGISSIEVPISPYIVAIPMPAKLQLLLRDYFFTSNITVTNNGISGTNSSQMLNGTDGSGSTFEAKMAISTARVIYCNHGINDAQGPATLPAQYRANLLEFIRICRAYGKIPVLMTPNPIFAMPTGGLGTPDKANREKSYVQIVRDVAASTSTPLIEVYDTVNSFIRSGAYRITDAVPDGIHPGQAVYAAAGQLMAMPILHPHAGLREANQFISVGEGTTTLDPTSAVIAAPATRTGVHWTSDAIAHAKSLKWVVRVDEPNLDLWLAVPIWSGGASSVGVGFDQTAAYTINQQGLTFGAGPFEFVHDNEVCVARNMTVGLHMVELSAPTPGAFAIGASYVRSRRTANRKDFSVGTVSGVDTVRALSPKGETLFASGGDATHLKDEWPVSRLITTEGYDHQFTAWMDRDTQFVVHGITTAAVNQVPPMRARMGVGVGVRASDGFLCVYQITGDNLFSVTAVGTADASTTAFPTSGAGRVIRLIIPAGTQNLSVYLGGALQGAPVALTTPYLGGFMGMRANGAGKQIIIQDLCRIEH